MIYIQTETRDHILIITLNRPEVRNVFNRAMAEEMESIIDRYKENVELRAAAPHFFAAPDEKAAVGIENFRRVVNVSSLVGSFGRALTCRKAS